MAEHKKLVLIDGHSILHRAFYGVPDLSNAQGLHTNAVYGFLNIMFKILEEEKPDFLAVAFDVHAPTFRHQMYEAYKGTRKPMPEELIEQLPVMKNVLQAMNIVIVEKAGLEADDILGTLAKKAAADGMEVSLVSGDRDLLQISDEHIKIRIPKTKSGRTEVEDYYPEDVAAVYQVTPVQFIDLKALMGDTSDNIPGVPKVGQKTATELMVKYGSLENIYAHVEEISKKSIRESLIENRRLADLSRVLATIKTDSDVSLDYEAAKAEDFFTPEAYELFKKLEFKNMLGRFGSGKAKKAGDVTRTFSKAKDQKEFLKQLKKVADGQRVGLFVALDGNTPLGAAISTMEETVMYALPIEQNVQLSFFEETVCGGGDADTAQLYRELEALSGRAGIAAFDIKGQYRYLKKDNTDRYFDILIAAYLLNPLKSDYDLETIASEHLKMIIPGRVESFGKKKLTEAAAELPDKFAEYCCYGAYVSAAAADVLEKKLAETGMDKLMREMEMPLSLVLYDMEREGVEVRREELKAYGDALVAGIEELEKAIHSQTGVEFNINSPKQLGEVLFDTMKLPGGKKTKTGYSTAADVLEKLAQEAPVVKDILEYRQLTKLKSTYADGLAAYIGEDQRIHTNFNQTITATGRISSTEPNLQNIPMRMELGRRIRKVFVPKEGCIFMDADYSQIELRVLAHMSGDEQLIEAYHMDQDIHRITAAKVFHTPFEEVTDLQRRNAKAVNFGIVYGISSFGLSQDLSISKKEAAEYIEQYFATYPGVKEFLDRLVSDAKAKGYITTMFGRRRPIPELSSSNFMQRSFGERVAMNSPIQGSAADIIKIAMIAVWKALREQGLKSRLILQVHDELVIETYREEEDQVRQILTEKMINAAELAVMLEVDLHTGENWYEAK
ncbi:DNA polymerase I [Acetatifactor muris]|uniref:DNA polymerase I n=1 Tax=Acetatifactor muris TaxID=879566 RepID=A0A2K4ZH41_9FIRM|nr:DNA polymerase I [Acetatifactor muris]MCR2047944.1 DNA polymerase I [Acetatifactor muris]SOY29746.1 DNA polymerase I [Acetatifactor muris]